MKLVTVRDTEIKEAKKAGKLIPRALSPDWLKWSPERDQYYVRAYDSSCNPKGLFRAIEEDHPLASKPGKTRAIALGEKILLDWTKRDPLTGKRPRLRFLECCKGKLEEMNSRFQRGKIRITTLKMARQYIQELSEEFGHLYIDEIRPQDWQRFVGEYHRLKPGQILYNHWKHMSMIMIWALKNGHLSTRWGVENPDPTPPEQRMPTDQEVQALLRVTQGTDLQDQILAAATMGMRLREFLRQSFKEDACCRSDMEAGTISICRNHSKTHTARTMIMSPQVKEAWARRLKGRLPHCHFVFPSRIDRTRPADQNKTAWRHAKKRAGIEGKFKFHLLRHYFLSKAASQVKTGKFGVAAICKYAGLTIRVFERRYLHMDHHDTAEVAGLVRLEFDTVSLHEEVIH